MGDDEEAKISKSNADKDVPASSTRASWCRLSVEDGVAPGALALLASVVGQPLVR